MFDSDPASIFCISPHWRRGMFVSSFETHSSLRSGSGLQLSEFVPGEFVEPHRFDDSRRPWRSPFGPPQRVPDLIRGRSRASLARGLRLHVFKRLGAIFPLWSKPDADRIVGSMACVIRTQALPSARSAGMRKKGVALLCRDRVKRPNREVSVQG